MSSRPSLRTMLIDAFGATTQAAIQNRSYTLGRTFMLQPALYPITALLFSLGMTKSLIINIHPTAAIQGRPVDTTHR